MLFELRSAKGRAPRAGDLRLRPAPKTAPPRPQAHALRRARVHGAGGQLLRAVLDDAEPHARGGRRALREKRVPAQGDLREIQARPRRAPKTCPCPDGAARYRPQSTDFLDISNPRAVLEKQFRTFSCLTVGDQICLPRGARARARLPPPAAVLSSDRRPRRYNNKRFYLEVQEVKPSEAACIIECDCNAHRPGPRALGKGSAARARKRRERPPPRARRSTSTRPWATRSPTTPASGPGRRARRAACRTSPRRRRP